jgi:hypothetical protein
VDDEARNACRLADDNAPNHNPRITCPLSDKRESSHTNDPPLGISDRAANHSGMTLVYRFAADAVVVLHMAYVLFVVVGLLLVLVGYLARWEWIRNPWFRGVHLAMIGIVVFETWWSITCPLTTWEMALRKRAGQETYRGDVIAKWVHDMLFWDLPPWVFTVIYTGFGIAVALTFVLAPPRWRKRSTASAPPG